MNKASEEEKRGKTSRNLLFITDLTNPDEETGRPSSPYLYYLQQEADLQGVQIDAISLKEIRKTLSKDPNYPLVLLDMPHLDLGLNELSEQVGKLRRLAPSAQIIVITASPDWEYARSALQSGADNYIRQSIDAEDLRDVLRLTLR